MTRTWQPKAGDRVLAVLPDESEIEGTYGGLSTYCNGQPLHSVYFDGGMCALVRTVKPLPTPEPRAPGARIVDALGQRWLRLAVPRSDWPNQKCWQCVGPTWALESSWEHLRHPVTVVDADPDWGES